MWINKTYPGLDYLFRVSLDKDNGLFIDFKVYEIIGGDINNPNRPLFHKINYQNSNDDTENLEEAQVYLSGTVKWDGCSNLKFDEQDNVMLHFCSRNDIKNLGIMLEKLYDIAIELMPKQKENLL